MIHHRQKIFFHTEPPHQTVLNSSSLNMNRITFIKKNSLGSSVFSQHVRSSKVLTTVWEFKMPASSEYHTENTPSNLGQLVLQGLCVQAFSYILNSCRSGRSMLHTLGADTMLRVELSWSIQVRNMMSSCVLSGGEI